MPASTTVVLQNTLRNAYGNVIGNAYLDLKSHQVTFVKDILCGYIPLMFKL